MQDHKVCERPVKEYALRGEAVQQPIHKEEIPLHAEQYAGYCRWYGIRHSRCSLGYRRVRHRTHLDECARYACPVCDRWERRVYGKNKKTFEYFERESYKLRLLTLASRHHGGVPLAQQVGLWKDTPACGDASRTQGVFTRLKRSKGWTKTLKENGTLFFYTFGLTYDPQPGWHLHTHLALAFPPDVAASDDRMRETERQLLVSLQRVCRNRIRTEGLPDALMPGRSAVNISLRYKGRSPRGLLGYLVGQQQLDEDPSHGITLREVGQRALKEAGEYPWPTRSRRWTRLYKEARCALYRMRMSGSSAGYKALRARFEAPSENSSA